MDIAVLDRGRMGRALAGRLLERGHCVAVWNPFEGQGRRDCVGVWSGSRQRCRRSGEVDVAITMLANDDAAGGVALGELRSVLAHRTVYVDCSTVSPALSGELAEAFPGRFLAVPVVGSPLAVRAGRAAYLAGGNGDLIHRLAVVLSSLSGTVRRYDIASLALAAN